MMEAGGGGAPAVEAHTLGPPEVHTTPPPVAGWLSRETKVNLQGMGPGRTAQLRELVASGRYVPFAELRAKVAGLPIVSDAALVAASRAAGVDPAKAAELERQRALHRATSARYRERARYLRQERIEARAQAAS